MADFVRGCYYTWRPNHVIRIMDGSRGEEWLVDGALYQIRSSDLEYERVIAAVGRKWHPGRPASEDQLPMFPDHLS
jgi:hypothetical protein